MLGWRSLSCEVVAVLLIGFGPLIGFGSSIGRADDSIDFERDVAPLLVRRCVECHKGTAPSGELNLTTRDGIARGGDSGAVLKPGDAQRRSAGAAAGAGHRWRNAASAAGAVAAFARG